MYCFVNYKVILAFAQKYTGYELKPLPQKKVIFLFFSLSWDSYYVLCYNDCIYAIITKAVGGFFTFAKIEIPVYDVGL